jgi:MFS family permease
MDFFFSHTFRALRNRNYRLFYIGQSVSLIGTWMQSIAVAWLVYRLTHSSAMLGIIGFISQIPAFIIAPFGGVVADRHNRYRALMLIQTLAMLQAAALSVLVMSGHIVIWQICVLSIILGLINAFDMPVRHAFTIQMLDNKEDLSNAIALNSSMVNMAKLIGPSFAGILIAVAGEKVCFLLNALSYVAVLTALSRMKINLGKIKRSNAHVISYMKEGMAYVFGFLPVRYILLLLSLVSFTPYQVLMPIFAKDIFHGGSQILGFLVGMSGAGALVGALYLAKRKTVVGLSRRLMQACAFFGLGLMVLATCRILWIALALMFLTGFGMMINLSGSNMMLQTIADEDKRGRVMSFYTMSFLGTAPLGTLLGGIVAEKIGAPATLFIGGMLCVLGALWFSRRLPVIREHIRPIYIQKGLLPQVEDVVQ